MHVASNRNAPMNVFCKKNRILRHLPVFCGIAVNDFIIQKIENNVGRLLTSYL